MLTVQDLTDIVDALQLSELGPKDDAKWILVVHLDTMKRRGQIVQYFVSATTRKAVLHVDLSVREWGGSPLLSVSLQYPLVHLQDRLRVQALMEVPIIRSEWRGAIVIGGPVDAALRHLWNIGCERRYTPEERAEIDVIEVHES